MSPLYLYDGKLLLVDGKLATNQNCCCEEEKCPEPISYGIIDLGNFGWTNPPTKVGQSITATFTFEDSINCGLSTNENPQSGYGECSFTLTENTQVTLLVNGDTEDQLARYDYGWILIDGPGVPAAQVELDAAGDNVTYHVRIRSNGLEADCNMAPKNDQLQINIGPGKYVVIFQTNTVDSAFHQNMVHNFSVTW